MEHPSEETGDPMKTREGLSLLVHTVAIPDFMIF